MWDMWLDATCGMWFRKSSRFFHMISSYDSIPGTTERSLEIPKIELEGGHVNWPRPLISLAKKSIIPKRLQAKLQRIARFKFLGSCPLPKLPAETAPFRKNLQCEFVCPNVLIVVPNYATPLKTTYNEQFWWFVRFSGIQVTRLRTKSPLWRQQQKPW